MKQWFLLKLYFLTINWRKLHLLVRYIYLNLLLPIFVYFTKKKFPYIVKIIPRNSILEKQRFNAIFSDIDLTVVIDKDHETQSLLRYFFRVKKFLPMLDIPEVYTECEYRTLLDIHTSPHWPIIDILWHIRKINWNKKKLKTNRSFFEKEKMARSIRNSFLNITTLPLSEFLPFNKLNYLSTLVSNDSPPSLCLYSQFLETNNATSLVIVMNLDEFKLINYLMPDQQITEQFRELKIGIINYEILITKASIKIDEAMEKSVLEKKYWLSSLIKQIS